MSIFKVKIIETLKSEVSIEADISHRRQAVLNILAFLQKNCIINLYYQRRSEMIYTKSLKYKYETDVFVAGGGPSGVAASLACETEDVRRILIKILQENLVKIGAYIPNKRVKEENTHF